MNEARYKKAIFSIEPSILIVFIMGIVFLALIIFGNWQWRNEITKNVPVYDNLMQIKTSTTKGQLLLERMLAGDKSIRIENIWPYYDQSILSVQDIINGRSTISNFPGIPLKDNQMLNHLKQLETIQSLIQKLAFSQWKDQESHGIKEQLMQRSLFYQMESKIDEIGYHALTNLSQMMDNQRKIHSVILMLWALILSVVSISLFILGKRRKTAEMALQEAYDKMEQRVRNRTYELKKSNDKLSLEIDERQHAEKLLLQSESKLRSTLDATPFPVAVVDLKNDKIFYWSISALDLFGHTASTASEWYQVAYPDPEYRQDVIDRWTHFLEIAKDSEHPVNTGEYRVTCKDGNVKICELYFFFLPDSLIVTFNDITVQKKTEQQKDKLISDLQVAMQQVKQLSGLLPICSYCKKIRDDKGYWNQIEEYLHEHSEAEFSHSICQVCAEKYYPDMDLYEDK
ncbi:PAS domain S-box protein [Desulfopila sp. IMCC35008]|uniref:PAS domain S-box protein n=1 Tax=Desulfopila sp. IMCC35008 TaxID=2653858 RepID=UPI0013D0A7E7|nr:PAS domain S-box protein [Desulfopila sp. IMCC35008]